MLGDHNNFNIDLLRQRGEAVDDNRVWETLQSDLQDLDSYLSAVGEAIREQM